MMHNPAATESSRHRGPSGGQRSPGPWPRSAWRSLPSAAALACIRPTAMGTKKARCLVGSPAPPHAPCCAPCPIAPSRRRL